MNNPIGCMVMHYEQKIDDYTWQCMYCGQKRTDTRNRYTGNPGEIKLDEFRPDHQGGLPVSLLAHIDLELLT